LAVVLGAGWDGGGGGQVKPIDGSGQTDLGEVLVGDVDGGVEGGGRHVD
jgi:hypothetical protein